MRIFLVAALLLPGCGNFNHVYYYSAPPTQETEAAGPARSAAKPVIVAQDGEMLCPYFERPEVTNLPPLPLAELARVPPGNNQQIDAIQQRHIEELRAYIRDRQRILREAYDRYTEECRARQRKAAK